MNDLVMHVHDPELEHIRMLRDAWMSRGTGRVLIHVSMDNRTGEVLEVTREGTRSLGCWTGECGCP